MDALTGTLLAAAVAWASVLAAIRLPLDRWVDVRGLRLAGGVSLGLVGARVLGAPLRPEAPLVALVVGVLAVAAWRWRSARRDAAAGRRGP